MNYNKIKNIAYAFGFFGVLLKVLSLDFFAEYLAVNNLDTIGESMIIICTVILLVSLIGENRSVQKSAR